MVQSQFSLSWDAYKSNICNGFSSLQQNGEFVDMTLAADGHFVKVHQMLMALVSPYLKELITSAPCQHPIIFLNNVSYRTLSCLLEYVYTGEVMVPSENLMSFIETAKALHIKGLEDLNSGTDAAYKIVDTLSQMEETLPYHMSGIKRLGVQTEANLGVEIGLPAAARKVLIKYEKPSEVTKQASNISIESSHDKTNYSDTMDNTDMANDSDDGVDEDSHLTDRSEPVDPNASQTSNLQFSVSIRGSLQVILNRYIYNLHSSTNRTGMRRWRCVEYRNHRCPAFVVTKGNVVLNRANLHNHSFHDKKILQKIEKKAVFTALDEVQVYKEKEQEREKLSDSVMETEEEYLDLGSEKESETNKKFGCS